jgi:hypothetical protein
MEPTLRAKRNKDHDYGRHCFSFGPSWPLEFHAQTDFIGNLESELRIDLGTEFVQRFA